MHSNSPKSGSNALWVLFPLSFLAWAFCFKGFLTGTLTFTSDALSYYNHIKFYIDNMMRGVFPLWDPNWNCGVDNEFFLRRMGAFNPLYFIIVVFRFIGISHTTAYLLFLSAYWFLGGWAFYKIAVLIFKDRRVAFFCFLALLFSSLATRLFDSYLNLVFVPMAWFFYFLLSFGRRPSVHALAGGGLALMVLLTTYIPFYFLLIFLVFVVLYACFYADTLLPFFRRMTSFFKDHKTAVIFCSFAVAVSLVPGWMIFQEGGRGHFVMPHRSSAEPAGNTFEVSRQVITSWAILEELVYASAFSDLRKFKFAVIYVPGFTFILLLLGLLAPLSRRFLLLFSLGAVFFLLGTPELSPVYTFVNRHVFFFKYFRNLHFFLWLAILPCLILLAGEMLSATLRWNPATKAQKSMVLGHITLIHLVCFFLARETGPALTSTYLVITGSYIFFILYVTGRVRSKQLSLVCLFLLTVLQPLEAYHHLNRNAEERSFEYTYDRPYLEFEYTRGESQEPFDRLKDSNEIKAWLRSHPKKAPSLHYATRWFQELRTNIHYFLFKEYIRHKFLIYDRVEVAPENETGYQRIEEAFIARENVAFITDEAQQDHPVTDLAPRPHVMKIEKNTSLFKILRYEANSVSVRTHFLSNKFLVYNDNYHPLWKVYIDGDRADLLRANIAFKGVWIPAGEHVVEFRFGSGFKYLINYTLLALFAVMLFLILWKSPRTPGEKTEVDPCSVR